MDSFKTKVGFSKVYRITPANYEKQTKKRRPYVLEREGMDSYYAVCPSAIIQFKLLDYIKKHGNLEENHMASIIKVQFHI